MTDIELSQKVSPAIAETYISAIQFIKTLPDYALLLFRTVLSDLCDNVIAKNIDTVKKPNTLEKTIDLLFNQQMIDQKFKDVLHKIRKLGNRGVHRDYKIIEDNEKFIESIKNNLFEDAEETRTLLVEAFKLHQNMPSIDIAFSEIHEQEYKQTIFDAMISPSSKAKLRAGLLCELLAEDESKKSLYIQQESLFHIQSLYQHAVAFYNTSLKISADVEQKKLRKLDLRSIEDIILEDCNLEPLYRYSKILCQKLDGSEQKELGLKYLKIASDRKHPEATAFYAAYLYEILKDYTQAFEYLNQPYVQEVPLAHRILCHYYSDKIVNSVNHEFALQHIQKAIDLGCADALFDLGKAYHIGSFVEKDDALAEEFLQKAIKRGNFEAKKYYFFEFKQNRQALTELISSKMKKIASSLQCTHDNNAPKIGRNDLCKCGSGKKYKKCCGKN
ncbi:MAG: DUF4145 domain-containing protein [Sulfurospirillaceae bacterium]|nr:DUF4145 domain-containing protein [Sulfurospirillaceae bacterium]MDD2826534.1 DUF4145 domain-containing protein [Sulfurospirillaceae bacterium]